MKIDRAAACRGLLRSAKLGHAVFAATMVALGILGLIQGDFTPTWTGVPKGLPAREVLAYLCAFISLGSGIGLLWRRTAARRFPRAARLSPGLAAAVQGVSHLPRSHCDWIPGGPAVIPR